MKVRGIPKTNNNGANIRGFFFYVVEACVEPIDEDDIKLKSDLTILLWQSSKSSTDNMMVLAIGHIQLPDAKT